MNNPRKEYSYVTENASVRFFEIPEREYRIHLDEAGDYWYQAAGIWHWLRPNQKDIVERDRF
jgi:hypothetical protein